MSVKQISTSDIRRAAMDLLARREHGAQELSDKLVKRFTKIEGRAGQRTRALEPDFLSPADPEVQDEPVLEPLSLVERIAIELEKLSEQGLQSDERLAEAFIRSRANRGQGPVKIKSELRQKGLADHIIQSAMEQCEQDWFLLAAEVAERKFRNLTPTDEEAAQTRLEPKERAKRSRFLQQRGFSFDHISALDS